MVSTCAFRTCRAGEKDNGWSKPACTRSSCLGSGDIRCPVGRHGTEGSPNPAGIPCLEVTILTAALPASIPYWNQHRTGHIPGCNAHFHPPHLPFHIKANQTSSQRPTLFSSVHMGTSAQAQPTTACITPENKAPYVHSQKLHCLCPWNPGLSLLSPLPLHDA